MTNHLHNNCESIDAAVFSSDALHDPERLAELKTYVGRWVREINLHERLRAPDLQALHDRLLAPRAIVRDDDGMLDHPDLPVVDESVNMRMFLAAFGLECGITTMEGDLDEEAMLNYEGDCSGWTPSIPAGDGWKLVSIHDTEDGPAALYLRSAAIQRLGGAAPRTKEPDGAQGLPFVQEPKYTINGTHIISRASGEAIPHDEPIFIFRARDKWACGVLGDYMNIVGNPDHARAIEARFIQFGEWSEKHPERMKEPDTANPLGIDELLTIADKHFKGEAPQ